MLSCCLSLLGVKLGLILIFHRYRNLKPEHEIVYSLIDEAGDEGIWSKTIKTRTNLHDAVFRSAIKFLESKALISDMKSVEHPNRKMYIKASVQPSERATGGPWFTDGELDEEFIATISRLLYVFVKRRSWYRSKGRGTERSAKKRVGKVSVEEIRARRDGALGARDVDVKMQDRDRDRNDDSKKPSRQTSDSLLPLPANYAEYPTLHELTALVDESAISKDTTLSAEEIQQLLDLLVYDGKIERLNVGPDGVAYKASRSSFLEEENEGEGMGSVLMEAPCGRCPVFDLCEEGGPVGPSNCEYFNEWLEM